MSAPSCFPSRQNTVESRSSAKPAAGHFTSRKRQRQSGRQKASMWPCVKRRKKLRIRVIAGETLQAQQRVQDAIGAQPFAVGKALRAHHH